MLKTGIPPAYYCRGDMDRTLTAIATELQEFYRAFFCFPWLIYWASTDLCRMSEGLKTWVFFYLTFKALYSCVPPGLSLVHMI